jgi:hypothetical protein
MDIRAVSSCIHFLFECYGPINGPAFGTELLAYSCCVTVSFPLAIERTKADDKGSSYLALCRLFDDLQVDHDSK